ncbi:bifunctional chorismate mutase/prephenate dehydrogenase [Aliikangiella marina]|uniref:Bifunctional chorismate mutase/prephenate dehydrogenase n=1 Tax=Aliikangiella marina TaxID=1712262 RepID=A0A545TIN0_9GAMM|nr:bifunctional chorismate mutase/prephenate dehydrogenase [Aliikangiella marina]TQV77068.1 bifunctional chorismate mutase/prephenate dehydrogenase [Aliikangiella marina]
MSAEDICLDQLSLADLEKLQQKVLARKAELELSSGTTNKISPSASEQIQKVVVIGGEGQLGQFFCRLFNESGCDVTSLEKQDWADAEQILKSANLVLVAVPIHVTESIINRLTMLSADCVLADITSIKTIPVETMLKVHPGPVVGLHPMFGPGVESISGQTVVVCQARMAAHSSWLIELLNSYGAKLVKVTAAEHDQTMAFVQVLRHFSTVVYGCHLAEESVDIEQVLSMSSPIYRLELAMVGRLFAQSSDLYTEIIFANPQNVGMMKRYIERYTRLLSLVETNDKKRFKREFATTRHWFGKYAEQFLDESSKLLSQARLTRSSEDNKSDQVKESNND